MSKIEEMLKFTLVQGHRVKGQGQICEYAKKLYLLYTMNQWFDIDDAHMIDINKMMKLTSGQGHKVKD